MLSEGADTGTHSLSHSPQPVKPIAPPCPMAGRGHPEVQPPCPPVFLVPPPMPTQGLGKGKPRGAGSGARAAARRAGAAGNQLSSQPLRLVPQGYFEN